MSVVTRARQTYPFSPFDSLHLLRQAQQSSRGNCNLLSAFTSAFLPHLLEPTRIARRELVVVQDEVVRFAASLS